MSVDKVTNILKHKIISIYRFEFWPVWLFYTPAVFYWGLLSLKARSLTYFSVANPGLEYSGAFGYSKFQALSQLNKKYVPNTIMCQYNGNIDSVFQLVASSDLKFPMIVKPDAGERGKLVEKVSSEEELKTYFEKAGKRDYLIQEFIDFPIELGVFYVKEKDKPAVITSILMKKFLELKGDGHSSLSDLIQNDLRASKRKDYLLDKYRNELDVILKKGECIQLEPIGNHNRGTEFQNASYLINEKLSTVFEEIASNIRGFNYGRFDLKVKSIEDLNEGRNIKIFEVNGINSEPAHIYGRDVNLIEAYRSVFKHMKLMYNISMDNHKEGLEFMSFGKFAGDLYKHTKSIN